MSNIKNSSLASSANAKSDNQKKVDVYKESGKQLPEAKHQKNKNLSEALQAMKHKIFVMSGKGGVGKSSVTVNLAVALANAGKKVGVLDVDIHGPSVPHLLGIPEGSVSIVDHGQIHPVAVSENLLVLSLDTILTDRSQAVVWRGPKKNMAIQQFLGDAEWNDLDFMIIDSPPGTGDEHLAVLRTIPDALCLIITTPQELAIADVRKALNFLEASNAKVLGVVENMSGFSCPHCNETINLYPAGGGKRLADEFGYPLLGSIPFDVEAAQKADQGIVAVNLVGENASKTAFLDLAKNVVAECDKPRLKY